MGDLQNVVDC